MTPPDAPMTPEQIAAKREVIADVWRRMNEVAFVTKDRPHGNLGPPSAGTEAVYAGNFLATLHSVGYELVPLDHIDTLTAAVERRVRSAYRTGWRDHEAGIRYREDEVAHDPT